MPRKIYYISGVVNSAYYYHDLYIYSECSTALSRKNHAFIIQISANMQKTEWPRYLKHSCVRHEYWIFLA